MAAKFHNDHDLEDQPPDGTKPGLKRQVQLSFDQLSTPVALRSKDDCLGGMIGKCWRNPITGKIVLKQATRLKEPYSIVDLWERPALYGSPDDLVEDPYLFKVVPLLYRTWLYHYIFDNREAMASARGDHGMIDFVMGEKAVDVHRIAGRWSPALCYAPAAFVSVFTADFPTVVGTVGMIIFSLGLSVLCNTPSLYRQCRLISIGPRFAFLIFILLRMLSPPSAEDGGRGGLSTFAFVVIILILLFDFCVGDFVSLNNIGSHCTYEVLKQLPKRIFVCRREGGAFINRGDCGKISEIVTGMAHMDDMEMIAEVRGIVVQLLPMTRQDWFMAWDQLTNTGTHVSFMGLDVFGPKQRSLEEVLSGQAAGSSNGQAQALMKKIGGGTQLLQ